MEKRPEIPGVTQRGNRMLLSQYSCSPSSLIVPSRVPRSHLSIDAPIGLDRRDYGKRSSLVRADNMYLG